METEKTAWVVVRALGIYFAGQVFISSFYVATMITGILELIEKSKIRPAIKEEIVEAWANVAYIGVELLVFLFLAYYCLRRGKHIHRLLIFRRNDKDA